MLSLINNANFRKPWLSLINQGGGVPIYWLLNGSSTLKKYLPDDQEIYKINTHYDYGIPNRQLTIELICNEFVEEILKVNRGKHCIIGGFSMGATFACETAQQLKKHGMNIDLLILLDPSENDKKKTDPPEINSIYKYLEIPVQILYKKIKKIYYLIANKLVIEAIKDNYNRMKSSYYLRTNSLPPDSFRNQHVFLFYRSLRSKYHRAKYEGKVLLMQRIIDLDFEEREWPKITSSDNLIFSTLDIKDHLEVVYDDNIKLQWINKIKENIY